MRTLREKEIVRRQANMLLEAPPAESTYDTARILSLIHKYQARGYSHAEAREMALKAYHKGSGPVTRPKAAFFPSDGGSGGGGGGLTTA
jgi:hypothetical protein